MLGLPLHRFQSHRPAPNQSLKSELPVAPDTQDHAVVCPKRSALADGHGPVFGLATPTNSKSEWSFDSGVFGRSNPSDSEASFREQVGYGFTPHLTLLFTASIVLGNALLTPTRIQPGDDFDAKLAWRFQHRATKVGTRFESTAFVGLAVPGPQSGFKGLANTTNVPGTMFGAVTGIASRSPYVWLGATFTNFYQHDGEKRPNVLDYSLVYGTASQNGADLQANGTGVYSLNW
jgi:hypothetical protein